MELSSPNRYIRRKDEEMGSGGERLDDDEIRVSDDAFDIPPKNAPIERLRRWRQAALVLNASRRFRYTLDLKKEEEKEQIRRKIRAHAQVIRVEAHDIDEICNLSNSMWPLIDCDSNLMQTKESIITSSL